MILAVAGGVRWVMAWRGMLAAAIGLWLMPGFGTGGVGPAGCATTVPVVRRYLDD